MRFRRGLIVGKFSPLHRGHQHLIDRALAECGELIIVSYAKPDYPGCTTRARRRWLEALYPQTTRLVVDDGWLADRAARGLVDRFAEVPHDSEAEDVHRRFTAWLAHGVLGVTCDAVFTSEDYGDGFAAVLAEIFGHPVAHVCVDRRRGFVPVSASRLRADARLRRAFLDPLVAADLPLRIAILGAESTGKSTLAHMLAQSLSEPVADEYGRELWEARGGTLSLPDMLAIGQVQAAREDALLESADRCLICDTTPLTTAFYSDALFGRVDPRLAELARRPYDVVVLCADNIPFVQDGTRQDEAFRAAQQAFYEAGLAQGNTPVIRAAGSPDQRLAVVLAELGGVLDAAFIPPAPVQGRRGGRS